MKNEKRRRSTHIEEIPTLVGEFSGEDGLDLVLPLVDHRLYVVLAPHFDNPLCCGCELLISTKVMVRLFIFGLDSVIGAGLVTRPRYPGTRLEIAAEWPQTI
jgi:hypothetical protein